MEGSRWCLVVLVLFKQKTAYEMRISDGSSDVCSSDLCAITGNARPIEAAERTRRLTRAQALMKANDIGAVVIEPGSAMIYFTGVEWWRSERLTAVVLPVEGKPCIVTPFFEEPSVHEDRKSTRLNSSH